MASDFMQIEEKLREHLTSLPATVGSRNSSLEARLRLLKSRVDLYVGRWVVKSGLNARDPGIVNAMEDGIGVAIFGLGQVVRQSTGVNQCTPKTLEARLWSGVTILRSLADLDVDTTVSIEDVYGFRALWFENPTKPLHIEGELVRLEGRELAPPSEIPGGCPFKKNMARLYPDLLPVIANMYEPLE